MFKIDKLRIKYQNLMIIEEADLSFKTGVTCIIGQSGSGKSSILNALAGQIPFEKNMFEYNGYSFLQMSKEEYDDFVRANIAYLVQGDNFLNDLSCYDNIKFYVQMAGKKIDDQKIDEYLCLVGLAIDKKIYPDRLSGGEKQRLALVQALAKDTEIILCDEITASLDPDNKNEIMDLLLQIAHDYHKTVIITSHDEDIFDKCDELYQISEKKVTRLKENTAFQDSQNFLNNDSPKRLKMENFKKYVSSKIDRQFSIHLIYTVICAFIVALCTYICYYRYSYVTLQKDLLEVLTPTEIMMVNQTIPNFTRDSSTFMYDSANQPFSEEVRTKLFNIDHIKRIYPYYIGSTMGNDYDINLRETLTIGKTDPITATYTPDSFSLNFFPYYSEENFDAKHLVFDEEQKEIGAYVNYNFIVNYLEMDLDEFLSLEDHTLFIKGYMPVGYWISEGTAQFYDEAEEIDVTFYNPYYEAVDIEIPIIGVIDGWYTETISASNIYLPIDYMESLRMQALEKTTLSDGILEWTPNAYKVYVDEVENMDMTNKEIQRLDGNITTGCVYENYESRFKQNQYVKIISLIALVVVLLTGSILAYAFGIYYYQKNKKDVQYLLRNGLTKEEFKKLLVTDICYQAFSIVGFGACFAIAIFFVAERYLMHVRFDLISVNTAVLAILLVFLSIIQCILSRWYYYKKVVKEK